MGRGRGGGRREIWRSVGEISKTEIKQDVSLFWVGKMVISCLAHLTGISMVADKLVVDGQDWNKQFEYVA